MMAKMSDEQILHAAADWWLRLRDPGCGDETMEQWLAWTQADARHLPAFERMADLGSQLDTLDEVSRRQWAKEFGRPTATGRTWLPFAAAAAIALLALGGFLARSRFEAASAPQVYVSTVAKNRDIVLQDGSSVALGGASMLTTHYSRDERLVDLGTGEAFFQVTHNAQRPFVVTAGDLTIRDIGTAFDVRRTGQRVTIAVTEGRVQIRNNVAPYGKAGSDTIEATAGQLISYDPASSALSVGSISAEQATAWRSDRLEFIDEPLSVVVANINRYSTRPVQIADADLESLSFTGSIKTDALQSWLNALPQVFPLQVSQDGHRVTLSDARSKPAH